MRWWLRTQRASFTALAVALLSGLALASIDLSLSFPALSGSLPFAPVPLQSVFALLAVLLMAISLGSAERSLLWSSSRNVQLLQALIVACYALIVLVVCGIALLFGAEWESCWSLLRNVLGYLSLLVLSRALGLGSLGGALPVLYLGAAAAFGRVRDGQVAAWAWPLSRDPQTQPVLVLLGLLALAALLAECLRRRRPGTR